jgi:hypothetical protein
LKNSGQIRFWIVLTAMVMCILVIGIIGYLILIKKPGPISPEPVSTEKKADEPSLPRMANLPEKKPIIEPPPPPSYPPDAPVLERARNALREGISPDEAVVLAKSLPEGPERADAAFLLLEYAADKENAEAASVVARYYDPTDDSPSGTIRKNPEMAYDWYQKALTGGQQDVRKNMARLRLWVETQAGQGSNEARQLLENWR